MKFHEYSQLQVGKRAFYWFIAVRERTKGVGCRETACLPYGWPCRNMSLLQYITMIFGNNSTHQVDNWEQKYTNIKRHLFRRGFFALLWAVIIATQYEVYGYCSTSDFLKLVFVRENIFSISKLVRPQTYKNTYKHAEKDKKCAD